jgi:hypothetical protein
MYIQMAGRLYNLVGSEVQILVKNHQMVDFMIKFLYVVLVYRDNKAAATCTDSGDSDSGEGKLRCFFT